MDFVQPGILQYFGELSSYLSALPVTAVTVFSALMLVWRSRTRWTLGAIFLYAGLVGWVVGGIGAEIEVIPASRINEAYERVLASDVRYRFVIDAATI